jgi:CDGSH-type Zn-finger protein
VAGSVPVVRRRIVMSELGEPMTYETRLALEAGERYALCRCGQSTNKPFCDGTHKHVDFDGTEAAPTSTYEERQKTYQGTALVVRDDRSICAHAGFCGNHVSNVWKQMSGSATDDTVTRAQVMSMVERCPSGALTYRLDGEGNDVEPALATQVSVLDDGPYFVAGAPVVTRSDGQPFETRNRMVLCRCGQSGNKPLCDGSHREAGFRDS